MTTQLIGLGAIGLTSYAVYYVYNNIDKEEGGGKENGDDENGGPAEKEGGYLRKTFGLLGLGYAYDGFMPDSLKNVDKSIASAIAVNVNNAKKKVESLFYDAAQVPANFLSEYFGSYLSPEVIVWGASGGIAFIVALYALS